uniref:Nodule-specific cysteine-rich peptide L59 n=1 Tax=Lens culinaris TaxID=3864 RepID=A0A7T8IG39_LENCU|nr:nodule-specific cysteine-rich peptide L59 [Lens culinaris]
MAQILKFVYALMMFLSFFISVTNGGLFPCKNPTDCPLGLCIRPLKPLCIDFICECDDLRRKKKKIEN